MFFYLAFFSLSFFPAGKTVCCVVPLPKHIFQCRTILYNQNYGFYVLINLFFLLFYFKLNVRQISLLSQIKLVKRIDEIIKQASKEVDKRSSLKL